MNVELQCCGLAMLVTVLIITRREKSLDLSSRRMFVRTLCVCIVCLTMDILSIVGIVYAGDGMFPRFLVQAICKLYLILLISQGYAGFLYVAGEFLAADIHKRMRRIYQIITLVGAAAILILPIEYYHSGRTVYSYGPSTMATYILAFILLVSTTVMAFTGRDGTSRRRHRAVLIWQLGWLAAALIQLLRPELLVVGFAAAFGLVIVYAELENPHEGIDRFTGQFTSNALYIYLCDLYQNNLCFSAMHVSIDYSAGNADLVLEKTAMRRIANCLEDAGSSYIFRESDSDFIVIYKGEEQMQEGYRRASDRIRRMADLPVKIHYTLIPDGRVLETVDEFMQFQHFNDKNIGRSECFVVGADEAEEMREYLRVRDLISWAIANHRVEVHYQPIYNLKTGSFTSAEALVRIRDSRDQMVMPGRFIPVAEENGLIVPLGMEVFRQVCAFLATGQPQKLGIEYIEVNLSMVQFDEENPAAFVQDMIRSYQVRPDWINLEITETADAVTRQVVLRNMERLICQGFSFSLDDFGTGRSNLDYFVSMPVQIIKFDYKFTHWCFENDKAKSVMEGIMEIMNRMQMPIVAEGVETELQLRAMEQMGVTYIQGFYFSRPLPQEEFVRFLQARGSAQKS